MRASSDDKGDRFHYLYRDPNSKNNAFVLSVGVVLDYENASGLLGADSVSGYLQFVKPLDHILRFVSTESSLGSELLVEDVRYNQYIFANQSYGAFDENNIRSREYVLDGVINLCRYVPSSVVESALRPIHELSEGIENLTASHDFFMDDFEASTKENQWFFAIVIVLLLFVTALLIIRLSSRLAGELDGIEGAARRVSEGDLAVKLTSQSKVREFNELSESIEQMRRRLANQIQSLDAEVAQQTEALLNKNSILAYEVETRRAAEEMAYQASRAKSEFLATMSHEIRTPLNGVVAMIHKFKESELSDEQGEWLKILNVSSDSLLTLINDILDFSKIESGQMTLEEIPFSICELKDVLVQMFEARFAEKGVRLEASLENAVGDVWMGDPNRIRQILINLIGNALKFTEEGSVSLKILAKNGPSSGLSITIEDTGVGIPAEVQGRLFKKFVQADSSTTRKHGGSGLGLAITDRLVELMGGSIYFSSEVGTGSIFHINIPTKLADSEESKRLEEKQKTSTENEVLFDQANILVVDDSKMNLKVVEILLKKMPVTITTANSGEEALEKAREHSFDLVLMDCQMPGMDGYETTQHIREMGSDNANSNIPIIALTGNVTADGKAKCEAVGMNGFLSKPVNMYHLVRELNKHLAPVESA